MESASEAYLERLLSKIRCCSERIGEIGPEEKWEPSILKYAESAGLKLLALPIKDCEYRSKVGNIETCQYPSVDGRSIVAVRREGGRAEIFLAQDNGD